MRSQRVRVLSEMLKGYRDTLVQTKEIDSIWVQKQPLNEKIFSLLGILKALCNFNLMVLIFENLNGTFHGKSL